MVLIYEVHYSGRKEVEGVKAQGRDGGIILKTGSVRTGTDWFDRLDGRPIRTGQ